MRTLFRLPWLTAAAVTLSFMVLIVVIHLPTRPLFPAIETSNFNPTQIKVLNIVRAEYAKDPRNYDQNVTIYSQGAHEPWCADFISWVMLQTGAPYTNPNTGAWRIPGVYTLQQYYQIHHQYRTVNDYIPQFGDIAIYDSAETHDPSHNLHAAIVLTVHAGQLTTIGGNENGRLTVSTRALKRGENGLVGFGTFN